jgi:guanylate kinase
MPQKGGRKSFIILLYGAPASGKSTILSHIRTRYSDLIGLGENITTRPMRNSELAWEHKFVDRIPDRKYYKYLHAGWEYALSRDDIDQTLAGGRSFMITVNDVNAVQQIKLDYVTQTVALFLFRPLTDEQLSELCHERSDSTLNIARRIHRSKEMMADYLVNSHLFDFVVVNNSSKTDLCNRVDDILEQLPFQVRKS